MSSSKIAKSSVGSKDVISTMASLASLDEQRSKILTQLDDIKRQVTRLKASNEKFEASLDEQLSKIKTQLTDIKRQVTRLKASNEKFETIEKLREEQDKLWEEQEKLLRKEAEGKLRVVEELLKQESGLTRKEWLKQDLPEFQGTFGAEPGRRGNCWDYEPQTVKNWNNFEAEVRKAYASVEDSGAFSRIKFVLKMEDDTEFTPAAFYSLVLSAIIGFYPSEDCTLCPCPTVSRPTVSRQRIIPDLVIKKGGEFCFVAEMERTATFRKDSTERIVNLGSTYHKNGLHADCIRQLMKYLVKLKLLYGVLSSADISYFVRSVDSEEKSNFNCLEISNGIAWDSRDPTLLQALYYMYHRAVSDMESYKAYDFRPARDSSFKTSSGDEYNPNEEGEGVETDESAPSKRQKLRSHSLPNTRACKLNLEDAPYASGGSSGNVVLGNVKGQRVAVTLAPVNSSIGEALLNEVEAYIKLRKCWGQCMPRLVDYGTTVGHGQIIYMATEFIIGSSIGLKPVTPEVAMAAKEGLRAIHMSGILHGDIHEDNILVVGSGVRFIDFGFARSCTGTTECTRELEQLEAIIWKNTEMTT
ncbi:unnamed protein product [Calypogeia fissa]